MKIFVTGATGFIGSAVVPELIGAGHEVTGLVRSDSAAKALTKAGAAVRRGSLDDLDILRSAAAGSDAVIHLAFKHDLAFSGNFQAAADANRRAIEALCTALAASGRPLVFASGTGLLPRGRVGTERDGADLAHAINPRVGDEQKALDWVARGVRVSAIRFPPTVHGEGDHGFIAALVSIARDKGVSGYIGDGSNRWAAVYRLDAAHLVRLAVEKAPAGSVLHAVAEEGVPMRSIAEVIGRHLNLPVVSISAADADKHFGWLATYLAADMPASSALTRERFGWKPTHAGLIADMERGGYFRSASKAGG